MSRLRARYAEILARIAERVADPARQEELNALAERLNPDGWVTADEVVRGLEAYEGVFAALGAAVGPRKRRRRRRSRPAGSGGAGSQAEGGEAATGTDPVEVEGGTAPREDLDADDIDADDSDANDR